MKGPYDTGSFAEVGDLGSVNSNTDVVRVVQRILSDLIGHPDEWENTTLDRFLEALARSLVDIRGLYVNRGEKFPEAPTWKLFAEALITASGYE